MSTKPAPAAKSASNAAAPFRPRPARRRHGHLRRRSLLLGLLGLVALAAAIVLAAPEAGALPLRHSGEMLLFCCGAAALAWGWWLYPWAPAASGLRFADVAGAEEAKRNLMEVAAYLKAPAAFEAIGARAPRGILLHGAPGTGKTLLARTLAAEAGAAFIAVSGAEFGSMFIGVAQARIRRLFARAAALAPCVVFIDELDALGARRLDEGSAAAREMGATLNQLLVQLDGFAELAGVVVLAATNRPESLDPALLRAGRFDRRIALALPTPKERAEILQLHARGVKLAAQVDFALLARQTSGFSGAELANLVNQAALLAVQQRDEEVDATHLLAARNRLLMGEENRAAQALMDTPLRQRLAVHECGHAIVAMAGSGDPVTCVSIVPRGQALGQTWTTPEKDPVLLPQAQLLAQLDILVAGRVAEEIFIGSGSTGADDDIARATGLALQLVGRHGLSDFGMLRVDESSSPQLRYIAECRAIEQIDLARARAAAALRANTALFERMVLRLLDSEELDAAQLRELRAQVAPVATSAPLPRAA